MAEESPGRLKVSEYVHSMQDHLHVCFPKHRLLNTPHVCRDMHLMLKTFRACDRMKKIWNAHHISRKQLIFTASIDLAPDQCAYST